MGAIYNWMVGNALLPTNDAPYEAFADKGIMKLERDFSQPLLILCDVVGQLERKVRDYESGYNPLGLAAGTIPFDIDPVALDEDRKYHFEQVLDRAEAALANCKKTLDYANVYGARLRQIQASETDDLDEREKTELAYKNQLIAIYGTPYPGDIGPGGTYEQGYDGPDLYNYNCMDLSQYALNDLFSENQVAYLDDDDNAQRNDWTTLSFKMYTADNTGKDPLGDPHTITYKVSPGGIRVKNDVMTGTRATEGSLQARYRDFLSAYRAFSSAVSGYYVRLDALDSALSHWKVSEARIGIDYLMNMINSVLSFLVQKNKAVTEKDRWEKLNTELKTLEKISALASF